MALCEARAKVEKDAYIKFVKSPLINVSGCNLQISGGFYFANGTKKYLIQSRKNCNQLPLNLK